MKEEFDFFVSVIDKDGAKEFLKNLSFPMYFLDFEAITNGKEWMYKHGLALDQQISSFSILKINNLNDDETKIKHYNDVGKNEDYPLMSKKLTDFYRNKNAPIIVWGQDLEVRSLAKLLKSSPEKIHKKIANMLANILDLQQLFYGGSFLKLEPHGKSSLDQAAKTFGVYKETSIKDGKKAHYILEHAIIKKDIDESHLKSIDKRLKAYNNSDVINMKRILVEIFKLLGISE